MNVRTARSYAAAVAMTTVCLIALYLAIEGRGAMVSGIGNGGARINAQVSAPTRTAHLLMATGLVPVISNEQLEQIARALVEKATAGDDAAAAVVAEIAALQRQHR